jgi:hypothetical protein
MTLASADPIRDAILQALASYGGIALLVVALVAGAKRLWKTWVDGKEPALGVIFTYALGVIAKIALPEVYGGTDAKAWSLHLVVLLFVAIGAKGVHDGVINAFTKPDSDIIGRGKGLADKREIV